MLRTNNLFSSFENSDNSFDALQNTIIEKDQPKVAVKLFINESLSDAEQSTNELGAKKTHPSIARLKGAANSVTIIGESPNPPAPSDDNDSIGEPGDSFHTDTFSPNSLLVANSAKQFTSTQYPLNLADSYVAESNPPIQIDNSLSDESDEANSSQSASAQSSSNESIKGVNVNRIVLNSDDDDNDDDEIKKPAAANRMVITSTNSSTIDRPKSIDSSDKSDLNQSKKSVYSDEDIKSSNHQEEEEVLIESNDDESNFDLKKKSKFKIDNSSLISLEANSANVSKAVNDALNQTRPVSQQTNSECIVLSDTESPPKPPRTQQITRYFLF